MVPRFKKILISNRGEIAVRIARACRELGITSVAVYSEADRRSAHVRACDEAYFIGAAPSSESYLNGKKILEVARQAGVDAIHPGYGFLSERAWFARLCQEAGFVFIGPPADAIDQMGDKLVARRLMVAAGVPVVPGTVEPIRDEEEVKKVAREVGYPVMLKASAGGGGKGMRKVDSEEDLESALRSAKGEAARSFGDDAVYLEKFVTEPRHVEVQVFADSHGGCVYLGERDCSVQRRNQKVIEESPCPILRPEVRKAMGDVAVRAARAVGYVGAGTIEFLLDRDQNFYFMEMNTRLQVEHSVTELVFGQDLVHLQIRAAMGEPLPFTQEDLHSRGAAIECRIYAEDPSNNFAPSPGPIQILHEPSGPWIRLDSGIYPGAVIPIFYDPMISKLTVWGANREEAIERMKRALNEYIIAPIRHNIDFHLRVMDNAKFRSGRYTTAFIAEEHETLLGDTAISDDDELTAMIAAAIAHHRAELAAPPPSLPSTSSAGSPTSLWRWADRLGH